MERTKSPGALYAELGQVFLHAGRYNEAVDALRRALAENAPDLHRAQTLLTLGRAYKALSRTTEALQTFSEAIQLDPSTFQEGSAEIAGIREEMTSAQPAEPPKQPIWDWLRRLFSETVSRATQPILRRMAFDLMEKEKFRDAEAVLSTLIRAWPDDVEAQEALGQALLKQSKFEESLAPFQKAIELERLAAIPEAILTTMIHRGRASAYRGLGEAYSQLGKHREAADALGHALELMPDDPAALLARGIALRNLGELEASEQDLRRATELEPENDIALCQLAATHEAASHTTQAAKALTHAAGLLLKKKDYAGAERLCERAINLDASHGPSWLQLGRALIGRQQYEDALKVLGKAADLEPTAEVHTETARAYYFQENFPKELEFAEKALALSPDPVEASALKGVILHGRKQDQEALKMLDASLNLNPQQGWIQAEKGAVLEALGQPKEAVAAFQRAVDLDPHNYLAYKRLGLLMFSVTEYEGAVSALDQALKFSPDASLSTRKGQALYHLARFQEAVSAFDEALRLDPSAADASRYRGSSLRLLNQHENAVTALQLAIDLDASQSREPDAWTHAELGDALRLLNRHREAEAALKKAISRREDYQWALARYGETLRVLGKYDEAAQALEEALRLNAKDSWVWGALGATRMNLERYRSALEALEKAVTLNPKDDWSWGYKGMVLRMSNRFQKAMEAYDRALELNPKAAWVCVEKGVALRQQGNDGFRRALPILEQAVQLEPQYGWAFSQLGTVLYGLGRYEEALQAVDRGFAFDPSMTWARNLRALILERMGSPEEAQKAHREALKDRLDPRAYVERGGEYSSLGAYELAILDFKEALRLKGDFVEAYNSLAWLYVDSLNDHLEEATELAEKAVELARKKEKEDEMLEGKTLDTLGWSYYKRGMLEKALPLLEEAARLNPESLEIEDHLETCASGLSQRASTASP